MCGICGFVGDLGGKSKEAVLQDMMTSIAHRGPDDASFHLDGQTGLGFRRLSIIDLASGRQPLANEDETVWIVFNGEIYNFRELRRDLKARGHRFRTGADTEVIVHAYEEWGEECLGKLNGMFGFAIWDSRRRRLFLAVDRFGIKPVYYAQNGDDFLFASEVKAMLAAGLKARLESSAVPYHMAFLWTPYPTTAFKDVCKLEPGHYLIYENDSVKKVRYWDLEINEAPLKRADEWFDYVREHLDAVVRSHMVSDVPLGAFLSGGLDSSSICAIMKRHMENDLSTYYIAFSKESMKNEVLMDETPYADKMASELGGHHRSIEVSPDIVDLFDKAIWHLEEPVGDPAAISTYLVSQAARETLTVLLSGVGGDEVFSGYPRYRAMWYYRKYGGALGVFKNVFAGAVAAMPGGKRAFNRKVKKFMRAIGKPETDAYLDMLCYFDQESQQRLFHPDFYSSVVKDIDIFEYHKHYLGNTNGMSWLNRLQYLDFKTFLPCLNLAYTDKMSMAASIEVRVPFLDHKFVEAMFRIPHVLKQHKSQGKYVFKKSMEGILPDDIIWRKKTGFGLPIHSWISTDMRNMVDHYLGEQYLRDQGIFSHDFIQDILEMERTNQEYYSNHIWALLSFQIWHEKFIKN